MVDSIKITALQDIGANIAYTTLVPVVNMAGTPITQKSTVQNLGNFILNGAGGSYFPRAAQATLALSVANASQPNITSVGTLTSLAVTGNITAGNINGGNIVVANFYYGDGGFLTNVASGSNYSNSDVANYLPTYTGNVGASAIVSPANLQIDANGAAFMFGEGGALFWPAPGANVWAIEPNIDNEFEIKSTSNVVISTDISNINSHFTFDSVGIFTAPSNVNLLGSRLNVGPDAANAANLLNPTLVIANTGAQYIQAAIINNDAEGSSDWSADGAGGGDDQAWTDMGFAGYSFNDANYSITAPGDGYLFVQGYANGLGGNMVIATGDHSNTADIIFATGGFLSNNEFARFDHANGLFQFTRPGSGIKFEDGTIQNTAFTGGFGNIATINLDGSSSNVLYGNGVFAPATGGGGLPLSNGNSIIDIATLDGNITLDSNGNVFTFSTDGSLIAPSNLVIGANGAGGSSIYQFDAPLQVLGEGANSALIVGWTANSSGPEDVVAMAFNNPLGNGASNLVIGVGNNSTTVNYWNFANDGTTTFPTLTVDLHNGGNQSAQTLQFGDKSQQAIITGPTPDVDNNAQRIIIQGQRGNGTGEGGDVYLWGGDADLGGGDIKIYAGDADNVSAGSGGYVNIAGGDGFDFGGYARMTAGQSLNGQGASASVVGGQGGTQGGTANLEGGYGSVSGGDTWVKGGFGAAGPGGNTYINGGASANGANEGGNIIFTSGISTWYMDNTGNLILAGGNSVIGSVANSSLDPINPNVSTMIFTPDAGYSSQSLVLDPTAPGHIHLRAPSANIDEPYANIFLGGEDSSFEVGYYNGSAPNVFIHSGGNTWEFLNDGNLVFPRDAAGNTDPFLRITGGASPRILSEDVSLAGPANLEITALNTIFTGSSGSAIKIYADDGEIGSTANLQIWTNSGNVSEYSWTFDTTGNLTTPGSILPGTANTFDLGNGSNYFRDAYFSGNVNADAFITTDGGITHTGSAVGINSDAGKDIYLVADGGNASWTFGASGNLTLPGNAVAINFANGSAAFSNLVQWTTAPVANTSAGTAGQAAYDSGGNLYVCVSTNTWAKFSGTTSW